MGGMLGFETDDLRIRDSLALAEKAGIGYTFTISEETDGIHPNTADMEILGTKGERLFVRGESLGGGKVKIVRLNNISVDFTGEYSTLIVSQTDKPGVVAHITKVLSEAGVNIAFMRLFREEKGAAAYTVVESDEKDPRRHSGEDQGKSPGFPYHAGAAIKKINFTLVGKFLEKDIFQEEENWSLTMEQNYWNCVRKIKRRFPWL